VAGWGESPGGDSFPSQEPKPEAPKGALVSEVIKEGRPKRPVSAGDVIVNLDGRPWKTQRTS